MRIAIGFADLRFRTQNYAGLQIQRDKKISKIIRIVLKSYRNHLFLSYPHAFVRQIH